MRAVMDGREVGLGPDHLGVLEQISRDLERPALRMRDLVDVSEPVHGGELRFAEERFHPGPVAKPHEYVASGDEVVTPRLEDRGLMPRRAVVVDDLSDVLVARPRFQPHEGEALAVHRHDFGHVLGESSPKRRGRRSPCSEGHDALVRGQGHLSLAHPVGVPHSCRSSA